MPLPSEIREQLARRHEAQHSAARRETRVDLVRTALVCWGWTLIGIAFVAWSVHTRHLMFAEAAFWTGLGIGNGGVIFTLLAAYRRGERRGDW